MAGTTFGAASPAEMVRLLQQGRAADALAMGRRLLGSAAGGRDVALLQLTAISALQSGAASDGVALLQRAHELAPRDPQIAFNLAKALGDSGQHDAALRLANNALFARDPDFARLRAELFRATGRHAQARDIYAALVRAYPDDAALHNNLGSALLALDQTAAARAALEASLRLDPDNTAALVNLAKVDALDGRSADALAAAEAAAALAPDDPVVSLELARAHKNLGDSAKALALLLEAMQRHPQAADLAVEAGLCLAAMAEFDRAEEAYRLALKIDPASAQAYLHLGISLEQANRIDDLDMLLRDVQRNRVQGPEVDFLLATALRRKGQLDAARSVIERPDPDQAVDPGARAQLLGLVADAQGDAEAAYTAFVAMNRAASQAIAARPFDGAQYRTYIADLRRSIDQAWVDSWPELRAGTRQAPIFLVGFPRSGTTLLDTMLMGSPALHVLEEQPVLAAVHDQIGDLARIPELDQPAVDALRQLYFDGVEALGTVSPQARIVDKLPLNLLRAPLIHRLFPDAKFILALRHPCDSVLSCFMQNFRVNRAMASFWTLEDAAATYHAAFDFWENARALLPLDVHEVRYEDLIEDTAGELARVAAFLGLPLEASMLDFTRTAKDRGRVRTPSYAQITQNVYRGAQGRWERYRGPMAPVLGVLEPWVQRFGYGSLRE